MGNNAATFLAIDYSGWVTTLMGVVLGAVISIPITYYVRRPRVGKRISVLLHYVEGISRSSESQLAPRVDIIFDGRHVEGVAISAVGVWNSGDESIRANDIAPLNPLRIVMPLDAELLEARLISASRGPINATLEVNRGEGFVELGFDFLAINDGFAVEIIHTAGPRGLGLVGDLIDRREAVVRHLGWHSLGARRFPVMAMAGTAASVLIGYLLAALLARTALQPEQRSIAVLGAMAIGIATTIWLMRPSRLFAQIPSVIRSTPHLRDAFRPPDADA